MTVRPATPAERATVMNVLDGAMLETDDVPSAIERGDVYVFIEGDRILGAIVVSSRADGVHVDAVAVRPGRRGQGIGSTLVTAVTPDDGGVSADFDESVEPFYASLGFEVVERGGDRLIGRRRK